MRRRSRTRRSARPSRRTSARWPSRSAMCSAARPRSPGSSIPRGSRALSRKHGPTSRRGTSRTSRSERRASGISTTTTCFAAWRVRWPRSFPGAFVGTSRSSRRAPRRDCRGSTRWRARSSRTPRSRSTSPRCSASSARTRRSLLSPSPSYGRCRRCSAMRCCGVSFALSSRWTYRSKRPQRGTPPRSRRSSSRPKAWSGRSGPSVCSRRSTGNHSSSGATGSRPCCARIRRRSTSEWTSSRAMRTARPSRSSRGPPDTPKRTSRNARSPERADRSPTSDAGTSATTWSMPGAASSNSSSAIGLAGWSACAAHCSDDPR